MFGIPVRENASELQSTISVFSGRAEVLRHAALIVWEKFPMANKAAIECAEHLFRQIIRNELPFGGKTFLTLSDFRQVALILWHIITPAVVFDSSIRSFSLWRHFHVLRLTRPIRNAADPAYADWVDQVGDGVSPFNFVVSLRYLSLVHSIKVAADLLFPDHVLSDPSQSIRRFFFSPLNLRVDEFN
jgi:hypothetical protein